ncbi:MAG: IclR family transcriptional regulator [Actinobacteria bacterium]|nr:IclR family transcriptional regulator [Actinomycetota bacterium]
MSITSVERALLILKEIAYSETGVGVREIARRLGISPSVAQKSVAALVAQGFARQNPETELYQIGPAAIQVGLAGLLRIELRGVARPYLQQLMSDTGESSFLGVLQGNGAVYIDKVLSPTELRMDAPLGSWRPLNCTAVGKVLLAFLPESSLEQLAKGGAFQQSTPNSICDVHALAKEMASVRQSGVAYDREEYLQGAMCLAAPVKNHEGDVVASVVVSGPLSRIEPRLQEMVRHVKRQGDAISRSLGFIGVNL